MRNLFRNKKGQGLVEYGLIIAGVALVSAAAVSIFGHKTSDLISAVATILPGAHDDDNAPIVSGALIETGANADGDLTLDAAGILAGSATDRLGANLGVTSTGTEGEGFGGLIIESE